MSNLKINCVKQPAAWQSLICYSDLDFNQKINARANKFKNPTRIYIESQSMLPKLRLEEPKLTRKAFDKLLLEAIDEALASLGDSAKQAIYFHLEDKFSISRKEIPQHLEDFTEGLNKIFGMGAQFLQILIMKQLHERIGNSLEWVEGKELVFNEYVKAAKRSFLKRRKRS
jgi:hypothetical protein